MGECMPVFRSQCTVLHCLLHFLATEFIVSLTQKRGVIATGRPNIRCAHTPTVATTARLPIYYYQYYTGSGAVVATRMSEQ